MAYAALECCAVAGGVATTGNVSIACLMALSFFMSIMYPTIFALGIAAAGEQTQIGAAVMVMAIVGGAVVPPALGFLADHFGVHPAYLVLIICFAVVILFGRLARIDNLRAPSERPARLARTPVSVCAAGGLGATAILESA
jgi:FHS family L-fucose permease-like MFS transporter